jgi:hypothetical protein
MLVFLGQKSHAVAFQAAANILIPTSLSGRGLAHVPARIGLNNLNITDQESLNRLESFHFFVLIKKAFKYF